MGYGVPAYYTPSASSSSSLPTTPSQYETVAAVATQSSGYGYASPSNAASSTDDDCVEDTAATIISFATKVQVMQAFAVTALLFAFY